ncbi:MAG: hypothetical protein ACD_26C00094G0002 [uncultured bacterium]|nr:MAG: hypothetical protein ACD_26C00094G0002 [uncultured bacterium]
MKAWLIGGKMFNKLLISIFIFIIYVFIGGLIYGISNTLIKVLLLALYFLSLCYIAKTVNKKMNS